METQQNIGERLKAARGQLGISQADAAEQTGIPLVSYKKYEASKSTPGGDALTAIAGLGINLNWLLTGNGPMLLADLERNQPLDIRRLGIAVKELEEALGRARRTLDPERKARAVGVLYEFHGQVNGQQDAAVVERLLELVT